MSRGEGISAVFDCMVYLQAAISDNGPAAELLRHVESGNISLYVGREILQELHDVISRRKAFDKYPHLTVEFVEGFLLRIAKTSIYLKSFQPHFAYSRDPKDEKYINLAVEAEANYLVSHDKDLLDLMTDYTDEAKEFRQRFRHLKIVSPVEFLRLVRKIDLALGS